MINEEEDKFLGEFEIKKYSRLPKEKELDEYVKKAREKYER